MAIQLPERFLEQMKELLGVEYEAFLESGQALHFRGLRVNTSKLKAEKFEEISPFPLKRIPWIENGFYVEEEAEASRHPYYGAGLYYLQEPSAMTPAACLPVEEGDRVLDLCAAPGGKATELGARLRGKGLLVANDISNSRAKGLLKNLELFGLPNILVTSEEPRRLGTYFKGFFDKILVDAPCSGEGMFRKDPAMVKDWTKHGPKWYATIQRELLLEAAGMLKPDGMLLYSTCTFSPMENEGAVASLLRADSSFHVCELPDYAGFSPGRPDLAAEEAEGLSEERLLQLRRCVRIYPHRMKGEGHFLALLQKEGEVPAASDREKSPACKAEKAPALCPEWEQFARALGITVPEESLRLYDGRLYSLPGELLTHPIRGLRFLRTGLYLGEVERKRFTPSQALAMTLRRENLKAWVDFSASDPRVIRYLKGESPELSDGEACSLDSGWCVVGVDGFPLGWGKVIQGQLRNKYYPGWRWQHAVG